MKHIENYNHKTTEKKWQKFWLDNQTFYFNPNDKREKFYALSMFLYPSGEMHMGHLKNFSIGDVNARYKRLRGYNVLQPTGADAFGLPAENAAIKNHVHPSEWTYKNLDRIMKSMLSCGLSFDTSRTFATCDPEYYGFQQEIFIKMYMANMAFQKESYVNWDPVDQTVLANEQVVNGRGWRSDALVEKKKLKQWFLRTTDYAEELLDNLNNGTLNDWPEKVRLMQENWIGKSEGATINFRLTEESIFNSLKVYTTRPDTIFGAGFVGISVDHPIAFALSKDNKKIADFIEESKKAPVDEESMSTMEKKGVDTGLFVEHPFDKAWKLPVYIANFILMDYGTGAIFGCPAHDERDYEFANKYNLPVRRVVCGKDKYDKLQEILNLDISANIKSDLSFNDNIIKETAEYYKQIGGFTEQKDLGKIALTKNSIKDSLSHGNDRLKQAVLKFIPEIINGSIVIGKETCWKDRDYDTYLAVSRTTINDVNYLVEILIKEYKNNLKVFYIHNVLNEEALRLSSPVKDTSMSARARDLIINNNYSKVKSLILRYFLDKLPFTDDGVAINSDFLNGLPTKEAKARAIDKIESMGIGERKINYRLRDWGISRQRYWGCPIPMVYCEHCGVVPEKLENLPVRLPDDVVFDGKGNPLDNHPTWKHTTCPKCGKPALRETDTMDTFVDSSWYFMRFVDLDKKRAVNTELCNKILPIDQYVGGIEHANMHLIYSRYFTKAMSDLGYVDKSIREPAKKLLNQGLLCHKAYRKDKNWCFPWDIKEENGKYFDIKSGEEVKCEGIIKMSKSKCNVVDVKTILENYGADSSRMLVLSDTPPEKDSEWTTEGIEGCWKYINRLWKLGLSFAEENDLEKLKSLKITKTNDLLVENHKAIKDVTSFMENMEYNRAIARIREFSNAIEKFTTSDDQDSAIKYLAIVNLVKMIAPLTPHLSEELNGILKQDKMLDIATWPVFEEEMTIDSEVTIVIQINGKLRGEIKVRKDEDKAIVEKLAKEQENVKKHLESEIKKVIVVPNKLVNFVI